MGEWLNSLANCSDIDCVTEQLVSTAGFMLVGLTLLSVVVFIYYKWKGGE